ncbi:efflux RND transporter periplasmic adaptor subunit [Sphingomonas sp. GCM10030256]|uniref:efflux RND transporter periplasmic adaptor subunit n=1 Tax=Sphingomonas sp. GCM10030256 TaxID=3273427 RepID=UPI00360ED47E
MKSRWITGPRILLVLLLLVVAAVVFLLLRKPAVEVETAEIRRGPLTVTVDDLGETRVRDLYVVSAPITGQLQRVPLKPGDAVAPGATVLARIQPVQPDPLDPRSYAQALASVRSASAALQVARSRISEADAAQTLAEGDYRRAAQLAARGFVSRARVDEARAARDSSRAAGAAARQSARAAEGDLAGARAALMQSSSRPSSARAVSVTSPVGGFVLTVPQESERVVAAGTPLVQVGNPDRLEIVTDLLSSDAVSVSPGADVFIEDWGGELPLKGRVRLVEPFGFTKISALGVEEQRVNVVIDLAEPRDVWRRLGHGFRVTVRIVVASSPDVLKVPISALARQGEGWSVFTIDPRRRARQTQILLGPMNDREAEVRRGLSVGQRVIVHPGDRIADGVRVREAR